jgi:[ribosomal protein S18]-alanine N-acetyltransferase
VNVRSANAIDIPAMLDLDRQNPTAAHWSEQQYKEIFRTNESGPRRLVLVIDENAEKGEFEIGSVSSRLLGFLIANHLHPEWELENIVIAPASRRKGLATRLLAALLIRGRETNSESVFLEVRDSNQAARALYLRLGFEESGRRKRYYADPQEDAVLYRLDLNPQFPATQPSA